MTRWRGKAAVLRGLSHPFSIEDIDMLPLAADRVMIKTHASPFCSTDVKNWAGELGKVPPTILGHASIGEVVEVGTRVSGFRVGQRVVVPGTPECGRCYYCAIGEPWQCGELFDLGGAYPVVARGDYGASITCAGCVGGYSEYMSISANQAFPIESDLDSTTLSMLGCGITTGLGSVFNVARVRPGESVLILGAGHVGLWMVQGARLAGASRILVVEPHSERRSIAADLGATDVLDSPDADAVVAAVQGITEGRGADVALEAAGPVDAQRTAVLATRRGGRTVLNGFSSTDAQILLPQAPTSLHSRRILSSQNGQVHMRSDLGRYTRLLESGHLDASRILSRTYDVAELDLARERSASLADICGVISFEVTARSEK